MPVATLSVLASAAEARGALPDGTFVLLYLPAILGLVVVYLNHAPEATTFMTKLVGITLVFLLCTLSLINGLVMRAHDAGYETGRQAELAHIRSLIPDGGWASLAPTVSYVAERVADSGLVADSYRIVISRDPTLHPEALAAADAQLLTRLGTRQPVNFFDVLRQEFPWIAREGERDAALLLQQPVRLYRRAHRGTLAGEGAHYIRYFLRVEGNASLYEVGYDYDDYRREFHRQALPLVGLMMGTTLASLLVVPRLLQYSVVQPLDHLLDGVNRVEEGDFAVTVLHHTEDEFGQLARSFNHMVSSLREETERREEAEEQVREERRRIARDLHDSAAQALYGVVTMVEAARLQSELGDTAGVQRTLCDAGDVVRHAIKELRLFIHHLNPPVLEEEGLVIALNQRLAAVEGRSHVNARLMTRGTVELPIATQKALYAIAQEALNNTLKHSCAAHITVTLIQEGGATVLEVADDGVGFDPQAASGGLGLGTIAERAGQIGARLEIRSRPGDGTRVRVTLGTESSPRGKDNEV
jgi:signal transduction histidine kinase